MAEPSVLTSLKVLFVEDDDEIQQQLRIFMRNKVGCFVTAADGEQGFDRYCRLRPDIVITDLRMPRMDGLTLIRKIRLTNSACPIIITTAFSDVDVILNAIDLSVTKYLLKPINAHDLLKKMTDVCLNKTNNTPFLEDVRPMFCEEERQALEKYFQGSLAFFLKFTTGKGPKSTKVMLRGRRVEVTFKEPLTALELALLRNRNNTSLVHYNREIFYQDYRLDLAGIIEKKVGRSVTLVECLLDISKNQDTLLFKINE